jgi:hypothetical protein
MRTRLRPRFRSWRLLPFIALPGMLLLAGCDEDEFFNGEPVFFTEIASGDQGTVNRRSIEIIRNQSDYEQVYFANHSASASPPEVDFDEERVIALFMGPGHDVNGIEVTGVTRRGNSLEVEVQVSSVRPDCPMPDQISRPYQIVSLAHENRVILIQETLELIDCPTAAINSTNPLALLD